MHYHICFTCSAFPPPCNRQLIVTLPSLGALLSLGIPAHLQIILQACMELTTIITINSSKFSFYHQIRKDFTKKILQMWPSVLMNSVKSSLLTLARQDFCPSRYQINWTLCSLLQVRICLSILAALKILSYYPWLLAYSKTISFENELEWFEMLCLQLTTHSLTHQGQI